MAADQTKIEINNAIKAFSSGNLTENSMHFFQTLGYNTERSSHLHKPDFNNFKESYLTYNSNFNEAKALVSEWQCVDLLFQLSKSEILKQTSLFDVKKVDNTLIETYLFFTIELKGDYYTRGNLSSITREINKVFPMPVMILFRHNNSLTLSVINRRLHKRDESKDVLEKVTLIKDINIEQPHRAHIEILFDLSFEQLKYKHNFTNFVELHEAWQKTLDTKELNKKFFQELSNWYFWAISKTTWPDDDEQLRKKDVRNATNVIRLITRLIFIWFLKEKKLVDDILFNEKELKSILNNSDQNDSTYYKAILQNLFFATLNTPLDKRTFRTKRTFQGKNNDRGNPFVFRYENYFNKDITELFEHIPFLNGGLFDCLDYKDDKGNMVHIDGFSEEKNNPIKVPDKLFFSKPAIIDLSNIYNDNKKVKSEVRGLINILDSYKFTITENTPIEEEVALDPELLGRVFENLLAYYNPETETTARKQTGSFYTPREIVNYMVDESLIAYLSNVIPNPALAGEESVVKNEKRLKNLISYSEAGLDFTEQEKKSLIDAIDNIKVLDPACGSGAFPMGMLHKLVHILHRLDPQNQMWKQKQIEFANQIQEPTARENALNNIEDIFNPENNFADYGRKLFLIRNCIYGVDIQPIAIQIAKLRFFISLLIDQSINPKKANHNIDPLPNLESKFVCANTLIGLQKSTSTGNLFDENYEKIVELKDNLSEIRKKYFNVHLPQEKKKLHDEYLKTRNELIKLLGKDKGFSVDAPLLVQYDPYNPLNISPFFDTEWMFGFEGFDIVIGNPPYGADIQPLFKIYKQLYDDVIFSYGEIYKMFFKCAINKLNKNGTLSFITSNTFLSQPRYHDLRKYLLNYKIIKVINLGLNVFSENVVVPVCVSVISNKNFQSDFLFADLSSDSKFSGHFDFMDFKFLRISEIKSSKDFSFYNTTEFGSLKTTLTFDDVLEIKDAGIQYHRSGIGLKNKGGNDLYERLFSPQKNKFTNAKQTWYGRLIGPYFISKTTDEYFNLDYSKILKFNETVSFSYDAFSINKKILWRQTASSLIATIDYRGRWFRNTIQCCWIKNDFKDKVSLEYTLALCNSKSMAYFYNQIVKESGRVFPQVKIKHVKKLPFLLASEINQNILAILVSYLLTINDIDKILSTFYQQIVDAGVYELYFPEEIKSAGCEVLKYLDDLPILREDWSFDTKLESIEKVHKKLADPKHPVTVAMKKMQEIETVQIIEGKV